MILKINGDIVGNDWKEIYDWFGIECSTPGDVQKALADLPKGDRLQVKINSGGGEVMAGQEMYTMLRRRNDVDIEVESLAASAASVIAMAGHWHDLTDRNADDPLCVSRPGVRKPSGHGKNGGNTPDL